MRQNLSRIIVLVVIGCVCTCLAATQATYYVDPVNGLDNNNGNAPSSAFKTIVKARDVVRTVNTTMTGDIVVNLASGRYEQTSTLAFAAQDSGRNGHSIVYQGYDGEPPIVSGGIRVTGWSLHDASKNIYKVTVGATFNTRHLFVNGVRAHIARSIYPSGWSLSGTGYTCPAATVNWMNKSQIEVVHDYDWNCHYGHVTAISGTHATMATPYWTNVTTKLFFTPQSRQPQPYIVQNAYELLDAEGEFYLNQSTHELFYKPRSSENMVTAEIIAPLLEIVMTVSNTKNITFKNINFSHGTSFQPQTDDGFCNFQGDGIYKGSGIASQLSSNILVDHSTNLLFEADSFVHLGATGLGLQMGSKSITVQNCVFKDISGSGATVGDLGYRNPSTADLVKDITLHCNLVDSAAVEYRACLGFMLMYTEHSVVTHNEVCNLPYSGISSGWGWSASATCAKNNEVKYNYIHNVMAGGLHRDGGGIYFLSNQQGSVISDNYIKDVRDDYGGLYPDQGSCYEIWENNVCENVREWCHVWSSDEHDLTFRNNYVTTSNKYWTPGPNCVETGTNVVVNNNWPAAALAIMNNAGRICVNTTNVQTPIFLPNGGTFYTSSQPVIINCATVGAQIRYSLDGSNPDETSLLYSAPLILNPVDHANVTIKTRAFKSGLTPSLTGAATFTILQGDVYEAEDAALSGSAGVNNSRGTGWSGTGFADFSGGEGSITWTVNVATAGSYDVHISYTSNEARPMNLTVNGSVVTNNMAFPATGSWDSNWRVLIVTRSLNAGNNTITLATTGTSGGCYDKLTIVSKSTTTIDNNTMLTIKNSHSLYRKDLYTISGKLISSTLISGPIDTRNLSQKHQGVSIVVLRDYHGKMIRKVKHVTIR